MLDRQNMRIPCVIYDSIFAEDEDRSILKNIVNENDGTLAMDYRNGLSYFK